MPELIGLDFETYSAVDLPKHGLARYMRDKTFTPLIGSYAWRAAPGMLIVRNTIDFTWNRILGVAELKDRIADHTIVAHNAPFEQGVLSHLGLDYPSSRFIDSAVLARASGGGGRLEAAAPQLLGADKMAEGRELMRLFSMPGKYQEAADGPGKMHFDPQVIVDHPIEWDQYQEYCELDAELGLRLAHQYLSYVTSEELGYQAITMDMNRTGWCVDVPLVEEMQRRYLENQEQALYEFRSRNGVPDLNLNSLKQLKDWCAARGINATSFAEKPVEQLLARLAKKLGDPALPPGKRQNYGEVEDLLKTKQVLGGSSLKKLQVILDTAVQMPDGSHRLFDQYLHCGAGQSLRTTGRSVQMQNLKRLTTTEDMAELDDPDSEWDNTKLAENIRQVFTASDVNGRLIVGDFKSVESRGLAWMAEEMWKVVAYRQGKDLYKVLAGTMFGIHEDDVSKEQRQTGKVGELACGYQAAADAVVAFAAGMGIHLEQAEAVKLVYDWRLANPRIVDFWDQLDDMLRKVVFQRGIQRKQLPDGLVLQLATVSVPASLEKQHPGTVSIVMLVLGPRGETLLKRYFHGCYERGRSICYYKPSDRKTGDLWKSHFTDPKTKEVKFYSIYGGKLTGILTQSLCREIFFRSLSKVHEWALSHGNVSVVGQFHDEIVVDWKPAPAAIGLDEAKLQLEQMMSDPGPLRSFPLAADIKDDYRYTK